MQNTVFQLFTSISKVKSMLVLSVFADECGGRKPTGCGAKRSLRLMYMCCTCNTAEGCLPSVKINVHTLVRTDCR